MTRYQYQRRPSGACQAQRPLRAAESGQNLANAIAHYQRPLLVHSGPSPMRMGEDYSAPYPYPWVRLDTTSGVPTRLDEATIFLRHARGTLDISLRLLGLYHVAPEVDEDPTQMPTLAPCLLKAELLQYVAGTITPTVLATLEQTLDVICIPDTISPWYPLVSALSLGWGAASGGYDPALQTIAGGGTLRVGQMYPQDLAILKRARIALDFGDVGWSPNFSAWRANPSFVRVTLIKDPARSILWDPAATQNAELIRIYCVGSEIRERGR